MGDEGLAKIFKKLSKPQNAIILFIVLGIIVVFSIILVQRLSPKNPGLVTEDQIRIQKGDKIVIVDKNGLVEYKTSQGIFYEVWDAVRIQNFFALMEAKAREYLANPNPGACTIGYTVTLYVDGREQTVCFEEDEELDQIFEELDQGNDISLSDLFDDIFDEDDEEEGGQVGPTLTPTPLIVSADEGEDTPGGNGGGGSGSQIQEILDCSLYAEDVTNRTIISNTLCVVGGPSPTPTSAP